MCEIVRSNFESKYPEIISAINKATFIALDTELTGINLGQNSLFDDAELKYQKLKDSAKDFSICQIGLSMFIAVSEENRYEAVCYNFYLFPLAQGITDFKFSCLGSCIEFLCEYKFNFNKFLYEGVPYLNKQKEKMLREEFLYLSKFAYNRNHEEYKMQEVFQMVAFWLISAKEDDTIEINQSCCLSPFLIHSDLRRRFSNVWTSDIDGTKKILIRKVPPNVRKKMEEEDDTIEKTISSFLGFSRVFQKLVEAKKPIVGHNLLNDLLAIYHHFYQPLPDKLSTFKKEIHSLFPVIYDTKQIFFHVFKDLEAHDLVMGSSLQELYKAFTSKKGSLSTLFSPTIVFESSMKRYLSDDFFHEAGFDSYMAGYVFLRLSHFFATKDTRSSLMRPLTPAEHMEALLTMKNLINVIRARVNYINLNGKDPEVKRPPLLIVKSKRGLPLDQWELNTYLSQFGNYDLCIKDEHRILIAASNYHCARNILNGLETHELYQISKYNTFQHSFVFRCFLWLSVTISTGLGIWLSCKVIKRKSL